MEEIFEELRQHFNKGSTVKLRKTKEIMRILELLFTPEQAEYALHLPLSTKGRISLEDLAKKMNKEVQEVEEKLEAIAKEGKIFATRSRKDGRKYYALWTLTVGIFESTFADGMNSDQRRQLSNLWKNYYSEVYVNELGSSNYPVMRVIPINQNIDPASQILPFEEASNMVQDAEIITVIPCFCRSVHKKCDHILEADFVFGAWADYLIKYRGARLWTKEKALQRLKECEEDGLVHMTGNAQEGSSVICNCCPCCCDALRGLTEFRNPRTFVRSNFEPKVDQHKCTLCAKCEKVCPMGAITRLPGFETDESDTRMLVQESKCIGCGLCSTHCSVNAICMVKVRDYLPARTLAEMSERYQKERVW
jgi:Na+-translocating ferredoxin:NAD+ oxidoreductase subunit B